MKKRNTVTGLGKYGVIHDQTPLAIPLEALTDGSSNIRVAEGEVRNFPGWENVTLDIDPVPTLLKFLTPYREADGEQGFFLFSETAAWRVSFTSNDVVTHTSGAYTWTDAKPWTGNDFHGITIVNNYGDYPQFYDIGATDFADMAWDAGGSWAGELLKCHVMRPYQNL